MQELLGGQHTKGSNAFRTPRVPRAPKVLKKSTSTTQVSTPPVSATTNSTTLIAPTPDAPAAPTPDAPAAPTPDAPAAPTISCAVPTIVAAAPAIPCAAVSDRAATDPPGHINNWLGGLPSPTSAAVLPPMSLTTSASSKCSARDAEIDIDEGTTVICHSKSASGSNQSQGSNKSPHNTTANAFIGLNNRLGEFLPIMRDFNTKLDIGLGMEAPFAPPAPPP
ncbi:hypothetical protein SERLA73DRAFT_68164 [Serpula lacrymans var. lacrymans S7.3]|uniref:Uncharacterized protein n=2 Tax=Serpula lacrymans var. lacrymans TaxID=341189 RepID=F8PH93_SERL3|nr:uncharacterized protein SERLADRAFT_431893 [Serpula lacrymans var. lacrymans S7.9]EGO04477.1 hypothetical protein SERLA73DRAFT_68164 [Serpula lacrymans var. lacrymans S7.3]EGO30361.1 hypothetical protein SERLADRAFT_431893 [Serpula lacrymans var. lacrymans S7.9]